VSGAEVGGGREGQGGPCRERKPKIWVLELEGRRLLSELQLRGRKRVAPVAKGAGGDLKLARNLHKKRDSRKGKGTLMKRRKRDRIYRSGSRRERVRIARGRKQ